MKKVSLLALTGLIAFGLGLAPAFGAEEDDPLKNIFKETPDPMQNIFKVPAATCGSANGGTFSGAPSNNLCAVGTASEVTRSADSNYWLWTCDYEDATDASSVDCQARRSSGGGGGGNTGGGGGGGGGNPITIPSSSTVGGDTEGEDNKPVDSTTPGLHIYECNDGIDNDGDGYIDFPYDLECNSEYGISEGPRKGEAPTTPTKPTLPGKLPQTGLPAVVVAFVGALSGTLALRRRK